jgi:hypothetical protein
MSIHSTLFADTGLAITFAQHADAGRFVYVSDSGVEISCDAIIGQEQAEEDAEKSGRYSAFVRRVTILAADASPRLNGTCRVDGVAYSVTFVESHNEGFTILTLARSPISEQARPSYRAPYASRRDTRRG